MSILEPLAVASMLGVPFTDYLNVTVPNEYGEEATSRLLPVIESIGPLSEVDAGVYRLFDESMKPTHGIFRFKKRGKVLVISASGMALAALRSSGAYGSYLQELAMLPHRVSMLHATLDYIVLSPPDVIQGFKAAAYAEEISLTRKGIKKCHVSALLSPNPEGLETGTLYLGQRANADVWAKIYDKRQERMQKSGYDPGPIVRVEVAVQSDVGATLKDAFDPRDIFFHFAGRSLVEVPIGVPEWSAAGEGYVLGARHEVMPLERMDRLLDFSLDLRRLVDIAVDAYGDKAGDVLSRLIRKKCDRGPGL